MPQTVKFQDKTFNFPDNVTEEQILEFLEQNATGAIAKPEQAIPEVEEPVILPSLPPLRPPVPLSPLIPTIETPPTPSVKPVPPLRPPIVAAPAISTPLSPMPLIPQIAMTAAQSLHRDLIAKLETGGEKQKFIRTRIGPQKETDDSSTAYGPVQITKGLLQRVLKDTPKRFTTAEKEAMNLLIERQTIALKIGGQFDRPIFEGEGSDRGFAEMQAELLGFENADEFLDAFDYGGNLGLHDNVLFKMHYENFARKMLNDILKQAKEDGPVAAGVWHGGPDWPKKRHAAQTRTYIALYKKFKEELGTRKARKGTPIPKPVDEPKK